MRILVLATDYPNLNGNVNLMYIHTRNRYYVNRGIDVTVINFKAKQNYIIDNVKVITLENYIKNKSEYDILISHAPNIRNHFRFLMRYGKNFKNIVFFFHGHEILKVNEIYPKPYEYMKTSSRLAILMRDLYDIFKIKMWKRFFIKNLSKLQFVFVSHWMLEMFLKFVRIDYEKIRNRTHIIYNSVGQNFETQNYDYQADKKYDFITIRNNLDGSKYCIDLVTKIAYMNPQFKFCVVGKGKFFIHNSKPKNLEWINKTLTHEEVIELLNQSKCALLPTRVDAQGVMACEIATFGIPLITSNISVCKEIFEGFINISFIDNNDENLNISSEFIRLQNIKITQKNEKFFAKNTLEKEIEMFNKLR